MGETRRLLTCGTTKLVAIYDPLTRSTMQSMGRREEKGRRRGCLLRGSQGEGGLHRGSKSRPSGRDRC